MTPLLCIIAGLLAVMCIFAGLALWMFIDIWRINTPPDDEYPISKHRREE